MYFLISPAKALDEETPKPNYHTTKAEFLTQSQALIQQLQSLTPQDIASLMKLSDALSELNYQRYQDWQLPMTESAKQALFLFKGDVYKGIEASTLSESKVAYLQQSLGILSGLYGLLRPLDDILPYRLEMGTALANAKGKNLYAFWGDSITQKVNERLLASGSKTLINLASNEYFKVIQPKNIQGQVITPIFKDWKNGQYKIISFYAKKARGMMVRYAADNLAEEPDALKYFDYGGYHFAPELSDEHNWVFTRKVV